MQSVLSVASSEEAVERHGQPRDVPTVKKAADRPGDETGQREPFKPREPRRPGLVHAELRRGEQPKTNADEVAGEKEDA